MASEKPLDLRPGRRAELLDRRSLIANHNPFLRLPLNEDVDMDIGRILTLSKLGDLAEDRRQDGALRQIHHFKILLCYGVESMVLNTITAKLGQN